MLNRVITISREFGSGGRTRDKDDACYPMIRQLMIECVSEAASLVTAYEPRVVAVMKTHGFDVTKNLDEMSWYFL